MEIKKHFKKSLIMLIFAAVLSFFISIKFLVFFFISTYFNAMVAKFNFMNGMPTEFELSTFSTILISSIFGFKYGVFNAIMSKFVANLYTGSFILDHVFMVGNYCIAAYIASLFSSANIVMLGFILATFNNITMFIVSHYLLGISPPRNASYALTNLAFNFIIFFSFGDLIYTLLK